MALIQWDSSLSVNVGEIDVQHQKLISMINELNDAMKQGKSKDVMVKIIMGLLAYTKTHFGVEERYFDKFAYPDTQNHKAEHAKFVAKVAEFKNDYESGKLGLSIQIMNFLSDWLRSHIKGTDKKYSAFFNEHGLK